MNPFSIMLTLLILGGEVEQPPCKDSDVFENERYRVSYQSEVEVFSKESVNFVFEVKDKKKGQTLSFTPRINFTPRQENCLNYWTFEDLLILRLNYTKWNTRNSMIIYDLQRKEMRDNFDACIPNQSSTGRFIVYKKIDMRFVHEPDIVMIYDLAISAKENTHFGRAGLDDSNLAAGVIVFPEDYWRSQSITLEDGLDWDTLVSSPFCWSSNDQSLTFLYSDGNHEKVTYLVVVDLSQGLHHTRVGKKAIPIDDSILKPEIRDKYWADLKKHSFNHMTIFGASSIEWLGEKVLIMPSNGYLLNEILVTAPPLKGP